MKQKARVEGSICEAYLAKETSYFCSFYFENHVPTKRNRVNRNDDGGPSTNPPSLSVFDLPGRAAGKPTDRWLKDRELMAASLCVLLNCEEVQPTLRFVVLTTDLLLVNVINFVTNDILLINTVEVSEITMEIKLLVRASFHGSKTM